MTSECDLLGLQQSNGKLVRVRELTQRQDADISILRTQGGSPQMNVIRPRLRIGDDGYSFGFPQGSPGDVYGKVIGRGRMLTRGGRYRKDEPVVAWTQIRRIPDAGADLSGISGGPHGSMRRVTSSVFMLPVRRAGAGRTQRRQERC